MHFLLTLSIMFESTQEIVIAVVAGLSLLIGVIVAAVKVGAFASIMGLLFTVPFVLLMLFNVRCLIFGGCNVWAWIMTVLIGIQSIVGIFTIGELDSLNSMTDE